MFPFEQFSFEMIVVLALGLMVLGPKDLPIVLRRIGQFVGKMRGMAAEFRASFDELARQSELDELRKEVEALRSGVHEEAAAALSHHPVSSPAPDPVHDYKPFDDASLGLDSPGFGAPSEAIAHAVAQPIEPPKPRRKRKPAPADETAAETAAPAAKPRKPRSTLNAAVEAAEAAPRPRTRRRPAKPAPAERVPAKRTPAKRADEEILAKDAAE